MSKKFTFKLIQKIGDQYTFEVEFMAIDPTQLKFKLDENNDEILLSLIEQDSFLRTEHLYCIQTNVVKIDHGKWEMTFTKG